MACMSINYQNSLEVVDTSNSFFINRTCSGGPGIFCSRLQKSLIEQGLKLTKDSINQISVISGHYKDKVNNILRLDGLYFKKNDKRNRNIFESYKKFDHVVFQGEFCKQQYEAFTGIKKNHSIIPNGVGENFFTKQNNILTKTRPRVIASASWRRHKRLEEIIEAFKDVRLKNVDLWVLGGKNKKFQGLTSNIYLFNSLPVDALPTTYQSCDAMIHLAWLDWCPNTVVEGLASGLPVLCSHNGGTKELVKDSGLIIELEEDYIPGTELDLYSPPKVDTNKIVEAVLELIEIPKPKTREDLKIDNVALKYKETFK